MSPNSSNQKSFNSSIPGQVIPDRKIGSQEETQVSLGSQIASGKSESADGIAGSGKMGGLLKLVLSLVLLFHFFVIGLIYFSNNSLRRMPWADDALQAIQAYTIPLGWYTELAPMSLIGSETYDRPVEVSIKSDRESRVWNSWEGSGTGKAVGGDARWRRLMQVAGALAINDDEEGIGLLALSLVAKGKAEGIDIEAIRFIGKQTTSADGQVLEPETLFEAAVVELEDGETTLVPALEPTRTVPVVGKP
ncbi:MAG: hypothetical protein RL069_2941 [Planctomycetota bacterium]